MASKIDTIADINPSKHDWFIIAKIVQLWVLPVGVKTRVYSSSIEMILMDDQGGKIHASVVSKSLVGRFEHLLREGDVYSIRNFWVAANTGEYKTTAHGYHISFKDDTEAIFLPQHEMSADPFSFVSFDDIVKERLDCSVLVDVKGILTDVESEKQYERFGKMIKKRVIELEDSGVKINCALWGHYVDELNSFIASGDANNAVVVIFSAKMKKFQGKMNLQNDINSSRIVFNPNFSDDVPLKKRARHSYQSSSQGLSNTNENAHESKEFADWIRRIRDGGSEIQIPQDLLIQDSVNPLLDLVNFAYPSLKQNMKNFRFFEERTILSPTLESVEMVNEFALSVFPGDKREYFSADTPCPSNEDSDIRSEWIPMEFLNDIKCSEIPDFKLTLKVGVPVMLMRDMLPSCGLFKGTRLMVNELGQFVIGATIISGSNVGEKTRILRSDFESSDRNLPFKFTRRQFPICLCFAMTIDKSLGQPLSHVGLFLRNSVLTHDQLLATVSRVKSRKGLKVLILDAKGKSV